MAPGAGSKPLPGQQGKARRRNAVRLHKQVSRLDASQIPGSVLLHPLRKQPPWGFAPRNQVGG